METGVTSNRTDAVTYIHPCYEINNFSYKLTTTPSAACVMLNCFLTLLSVATVCGNLLVIFSVFYFKQLHTPTNFLILSLAVADLLIGIIVFPLAMVFTFSLCMHNEDLFCRIRDSFGIYFCTCSILHLCCISVDRYYSVCQPLLYKSKISPHVVVFMITISWGGSALIGIGASPKSKHKCQVKCFIDALMNNPVGPTLSFYLPLVIMLCIYLKIYLVAQRQARTIQIRMNCGATVNKMERKATKTLAIVLGVFIICWTPFFLCFTLLPFTNISVPVPVLEALMCLSLTNSTINPFIYAFFIAGLDLPLKLLCLEKYYKMTLPIQSYISSLFKVHKHSFKLSKT